MSDDNIIDFLDDEGIVGDSLSGDSGDSDEVEEFVMPSLEDLGIPDRPDISDEYAYEDEEFQEEEPYDDDFDLSEVLLPGEAEEIIGEESFLHDSFLDQDTSVVQPKTKSNNFKHLVDDIDDDLDDEVEYNTGDSIEAIISSGIATFHDKDEFDDQSFNASAFGSSSYDLEDDEEMASIRRFSLERVLNNAIDSKASDVHVNANEYVYFSIDGDALIRDEFGIVEDKQAHHVFENVTNHKRRDEYIQDFELDTSYVLKMGPHKGRRFRINIARSFGEVSLTGRVISKNIPTVEELGLSDELIALTKNPNGLVLICGPTGSGKSTTFASTIELIRTTMRKKIVTIEKPIEYVYPRSGLSLVVQREVGPDTRSFAAALKSCMRQSPDIILVGEVRDREEFDELLKASESGHFSMSTMHTNSPPATISRIMSLYGGDEQSKVLNTLQDNLRGLVNQVLVKRKDGQGRIGVQSILTINKEVGEMIGRGDTVAMQDYMEERELTIEDKLVEKVFEDLITVEEALNHTVFPEKFKQLLTDKGFKS